MVQNRLHSRGAKLHSGGTQQWRSIPNGDPISHVQNVLLFARTVYACRRQKGSPSPVGLMFTSSSTWNRAGRQAGKKHKSEVQDIRVLRQPCFGGSTDPLDTTHCRHKNEPYCNASPTIKDVPNGANDFLRANSSPCTCTALTADVYPPPTTSATHTTRGNHKNFDQLKKIQYLKHLDRAPPFLPHVTLTSQSAS